MHYDTPWVSSRFSLKHVATAALLTPLAAGSAAAANPAVLRRRFALAAGLGDIGVTVASAVVVGVVYHLAFYRDLGPMTSFLLGGIALGLLFVAANVLKGEYDIARFLTFSRHAGRVFLLWNLTFVAVLLLVFLTKTTGDFSRATIVLVYGVGYAALVGTRFARAARVRRDASLGQAIAQRVLLVGDEAEIARFTARHEPSDGLRIVAAAVLRGPDTMTDDLALAAASARILRPDDIFILMPWSDEMAVDRCVAAFKRLPAAIHLGPDRVLDRFAEARISRIGAIASLNLVRHPLTRTELAVKRCLDVAVAGAMLVFLSPLFLVVAAAIKLDSRGPVLFLQRRYGFNQEPFRIVKFRSMTTMEEGRAVRQATRNDSRVTRVGHVLRRFNIDELPQLLNVLRGEMSLVGPRPHALAHDQMFDRTITAYARRHNVKPGITGLAQVNGLRGPFLEEGAMQSRVEHDLHYIDHWSLALDLRILVLTLVSLKAFRNAF